MFAIRAEIATRKRNSIRTNELKYIKNPAAYLNQKEYDVYLDLKEELDQNNRAEAEYGKEVI